MFPNASEVSEMVVSRVKSLFDYFRAALKTIHLFGCLKGTLVIPRVLHGFLVSSEAVDNSDWPDQKYKALSG